jgi:hypothetical protein
MRFINKKAQNVKRDRFNKSQYFQHEIKKNEENIMIASSLGDDIEQVSIDELENTSTEQPKKRKTKKQENNNIEAVQ